jgi:hypothetical protein
MDRGRLCRNVLLVAAAAGLAAPWASAQQRQEQDKDEKQHPQQAMDTAQLEPESVTIVGVDLDGDGQTDTVYRISRFDFEQLREQAQREKEGGGGVTFMQTSMRGGQTRVRGTVEATKTARLEGMPRPHMLAKIRKDDGNVAFADLGPVHMNQVQVQEGDQIELSGRIIVVNDRPVLFADRLRTDEGTMNIQRGMGREMGRGMQAGSQDTGRGTMQQRQQPRMQSAAYGARREIEGRIISKEQLRIGDSEPYTLVKVRTDEGEEHLVNLGPQQQLRDLNIEQGDTITVKARGIELLGETMYLADEVEADGRTKQIKQRRDAPSNTGGSPWEVRGSQD